MKKKRKLNIKKVVLGYILITLIGFIILNLLPDEVNYTWYWIFGFSIGIIFFTCLIWGDE